MTGRVITHCRPWHPSPESRSETPITPQRSSAIPLLCDNRRRGKIYTILMSHKKRRAAGAPAWNRTEKHSFETYKWISDNAWMRTNPVALALMLTERPAEVKEGFIKMEGIIRFMLLWLFLVRSLLCRSDSLSPQTGSVGSFACSQDCANSGDWIKASEKWMIREILYMWLQTLL